MLAYLVKLSLSFMYKLFQVSALSGQPLTPDLSASTSGATGIANVCRDSKSPRPTKKTLMLPYELVQTILH